MLGEADKLGDLSRKREILVIIMKMQEQKIDGECGGGLKV